MEYWNMRIKFRVMWLEAFFSEMTRHNAYFEDEGSATEFAMLKKDFKHTIYVWNNNEWQRY